MTNPPDRPLLVVDSSAIAAILFAEQGAEDVPRRLDGAALAAPQWLAVELANVCVKKMRLRPRDQGALMEAYGDLGQLGISFHPIVPADVMLLAHASRLSFYDACYLWLARRLERHPC